MLFALMSAPADSKAFTNSVSPRAAASCSGREILVGLGVGIGAVIEQYSCDLQPSRRNSGMKGRDLHRFAALQIQIGTCRDQRFNGFLVTEENSEAERKESIRSICIQERAVVADQFHSALCIAHRCRFKDV